MTQPNGGYRQDQELRARIQAFSPDEPGIVFPFSARLARENGWTRAFAERVVEEYRRFLYLAMTAGHPVTPSVQVDQAWHQHLTYTRSYWDDLCGRVLGRPLHHEPTRGGSAEGGKFVDWYARTLDSYRAAFGHEPPRDVWPTPAERFASKAHLRQVSDATHWIVRKPRLPRESMAAAAGFGALLLVGACAGMGEPGWAAIGVIVVAVIIGIVVRAAQGSQPPQPDARRILSRSHRRRARRWGGGGGGGGLFFFGGSDSSSDCGDSGGSCGDGGGGCGGGGCGGGGCGG
ncbi:MAG TPA: hypothetical protein VGC13_10865 [Longimicrobium sp.]|uniref:glycine-rich domain-containing protein n=1 Tax=Longimicrobium sp. TaxID=2029185 RepID=UPI002EDB529B